MITNEQIEAAIRNFANDPAENLALLAEAIAETHERNTDMANVINACYTVLKTMVDYVDDKDNPPLFVDLEVGAYMYAELRVTIDTIQSMVNKYREG